MGGLSAQHNSITQNTAQRRPDHRDEVSREHLHRSTRHFDAKSAQINPSGGEGRNRRDHSASVFLVPRDVTPEKGLIQSIRPLPVAVRQGLGRASMCPVRSWESVFSSTASKTILETGETRHGQWSTHRWHIFYILPPVVLYFIDEQWITIHLLMLQFYSHFTRPICGSFQCHI